MGTTIIFHRELDFIGLAQPYNTIRVPMLQREIAARGLPMPRIVARETESGDDVDVRVIFDDTLTFEQRCIVAATVVAHKGITGY
jgi:hypothetical protein